MIKEQLYLFLPYTGSNMSIYTNNKQIYTIMQHSSSKNNTFYIKKGVKRLNFVLYTSTKHISLNIWEQSMSNMDSTSQ